VAEDNMNRSLDPLDARIILALEAAPRPEIPAEFAARVAAQLPAHPPAILTPGRYGHLAAIACLVALVVMMLAFAPRATGASLYWLSIESILCAQFALLTVWLVARNAGYTSASTF
jgi:hypothetical protein